MTEAASADKERSRALMVLLAGACVIGLAPILVRLAGAGPSAVGFWRLTFSLPLLVVLARHAGEVLSRDQILQRLRGIEFNGTDRSVDVAISKLRRKFDDHAGEARKIKTVWGKGYLFSRSEWEC